MHYYSGEIFFLPFFVREILFTFGGLLIQTTLNQTSILLQKLFWPTKKEIMLVEVIGGGGRGAIAPPPPPSLPQFLEDIAYFLRYLKKKR